MKHWRFGNHEKLPLYKQLEQAVVRDIRNGIYRTGDLVPSISEMDEALSLGRVTIVNALREMARNGHIKACHGSGHFVSRRGGNPVIGLILPLCLEKLPLYSALATGLQMEAERYDHYVELVSSDDDPQRFIWALDEVLLTRHCHWLAAVLPIQLRTGEVSMASLRMINRRRRKTRNVLILDQDEAENFPCLCQNRVQATELLLARACARGARKLALIEGSLHMAELEKRLTQLKPPADVTIAVLRAESPETNLAQIRKHGYDAVLCGNDVMARRLLRAAEGQPGFLLAGYGATPVATLMAPAITTVDPDMITLGKAAFTVLSGQCSANEARLQVTPKLVPGETL